MFQTSALKFRPPERLLDFNCYLNQHLLVLTKAPHGFKIQPNCQLLITLSRQAVILPAILMRLFSICEILQKASENLILKCNSTDIFFFVLMLLISQTLQHLLPSSTSTSPGRNAKPELGLMYFSVGE